MPSCCQQGQARQTLQCQAPDCKSELEREDYLIPSLKTCWPYSDTEVFLNITESLSIRSWVIIDLNYHRVMILPAKIILFQQWRCLPPPLLHWGFFLFILFLLRKEIWGNNSSNCRSVFPGLFANLNGQSLSHVEIKNNQGDDDDWIWRGKGRLA